MIGVIEGDGDGGIAGWAKKTRQKISEKRETKKVPNTLLFIKRN